MEGLTLRLFHTYSSIIILFQMLVASTLSLHSEYTCIDQYSQHKYLESLDLSC